MKIYLNKPNLHIKHILKSRIALSTVVTTLIILVISVLLASVVTYFAINVVSTRVQEESVALTKQHLYHNSSAVAGSLSYSQATLMVINTGGRDLVIDKIAVRGQECSWNDTSSNKVVYYSITTDSVSSDMNYVPDFASGDTSVLMGTKSYSFTRASNDLTLKSGYTMMIYIINPDSITINDIGLTVSITLYTAQAMYYRETNVQAVEDISSAVIPVSSGDGTPTPTPSASPTPTPSQPEVAFANLHAWFDNLGSQVAFVVTNNRVTDLQIYFDSFTVDGQESGLGFISIGTFTVSTSLPYESITPGETSIDGHVLVNAGPSYIVPDGQTAIVYVVGCIGIDADDIGKSVQISFMTNVGLLTQSATVEDVTSQINQ